MDDSEPRELELTPELIEYANSIALHEAEKRCPKYVDYGDVAQEVLLHLVSKPPKYDPAKGASAKTLIHTIVQRGVLKYVARQCRHAGRFKQVDEAKAEAPDDDDQLRPQRDAAERRPVDREGTADLGARTTRPPRRPGDANDGRPEGPPVGRGVRRTHRDQPRGQDGCRLRRGRPRRGATSQFHTATHRGFHGQPRMVLLRLARRGRARVPGTGCSLSGGRV
ncbi:MAG: sigma-70 family RNA polymerase sigma factor [Planctomycetes bacterium]|nr:sigma-70 family RNA polymerase sigma factor [Planctomycetota bacterium]